MPYSFWSRLLFFLTLIGALLTLASWVGGRGRWVILAVVGGLLLQAVPVYLIHLFALNRNRRRALDCIEALGGRITARLAADPRCILELDLTHAPLPQMNWEALPALLHVEALNLSHTALTDDRLEDLGRLPALRHLNLNGTLLTDAGLSALREFPHLESISLSHAQVTEDGVAELLHFKPKLQVVASHIFGSDVPHSLQDVSHDRFL